MIKVVITHEAKAQSNLWAAFLKHNLDMNWLALSMFKVSSSWAVAFGVAQHIPRIKT